VDVPELLELSNTNPEYVDLLKAASTSSSDAETTLAAVERSLADAGHLSATRVEVANELFYRPGTATERAANELYALLELERGANGTPHLERTVAA
jgi:hypothetical protein